MSCERNYRPDVSRRQPTNSGGVLFYPSPLAQELDAAIGSLHARTRTLITQQEATDLSHEVAGVLRQEQNFGSFGAGEEAIVDRNLSGGCCIAAAVVAVTLRRRNHSGWVVGGTPLFEDKRYSNHWWAQTDDGWVIDPTFGQFRWTIDPIAAPSTNLLHANRFVYPREFMRWRGHPTLPTSHKTVVDRLLTRLTGAPYVWE